MVHVAMKLTLLSVLALVTLAGCSVAAPTEEAATTDESSDALSSITDKPAVVPADGAKPTVQSVDVSNVHFDLSDFKDVHGKLDLSRLDLDVLDTGTDDHVYEHRQSDEELQWVQSDKRELPAFVDTIAHGVDVGGGGKCRISSLSLKKVVVGCKWTW